MFFISKEPNLANQSKGTPVIKLNNMFMTDKEKGGSTFEKLNDFCGYTTAHGFGRLVESKSHVRKTFWVMACLGAFTMFSCQVIWLAQDYISKPVETYITMKHVKVRDFSLFAKDSFIVKTIPLSVLWLEKSLRVFR